MRHDWLINTEVIVVAGQAVVTGFCGCVAFRADRPGQWFEIGLERGRRAILEAARIVRITIPLMAGQAAPFIQKAEVGGMRKMHGCL